MLKTSQFIVLPDGLIPKLLHVHSLRVSSGHFSNGDWNTGGRCDNTIPLTKGNEVQQEESSDPVIGDAVKGTKVNLLGITAISELRDESHLSHYSLKASEGINDCLHWCLPGIPDTWNELLLLTCAFYCILFVSRVIHIPGKRNSYSQVKSETKQDANAMHYMGYNASSAENTEAAAVLERRS
ncbi:hypothetical protein KY285_024724 [Solanum tuberosum]|nr:hypothetical protein KY285_024724 [Solanum tuberosum]